MISVIGGDIVSEIKKGFYKNGNEGIYVTSDQYIWEYKWFYHGEPEEVYFFAKEVRTGKVVTLPLETKGNLQPEIESILKERTDLLKQTNQ